MNASPIRYRRLSFLGFPHYRIGSDGSTWSLHGRGPKRKGRDRTKWSRLKQYAGEYGHLWVLLYNDAGTKKYLVHRLVLLAFVGPCPEGMECRHFPDGDASNNHLENLQWATHAVNQRDRILQGTSCSGETNSNAKLKDSDIPIIHKLRNSGKTYKSIADIYGVTLQNIRYIIKGKTFKHCQPPYSD